NLHRVPGCHPVSRGGPAGQRRLSTAAGGRVPRREDVLDGLFTGGDRDAVEGPAFVDQFEAPDGGVGEGDDEGRGQRGDGGGHEHSGDGSPCKGGRPDGQCRGGDLGGPAGPRPGLRRRLRPRPSARLCPRPRLRLRLRLGLDRSLAVPEPTEPQHGHRSASSDTAYVKRLTRMSADRPPPHATARGGKGGQRTARRKALKAPKPPKPPKPPKRSKPPTSGPPGAWSAVDPAGGAPGISRALHDAYL